MHLVVCHVGDTSAVEAYRALRARAPGRVDCVSVETLCAGLVWEHRLESHSTVFRVRLADGRLLDGEDIDSVLNRIHTVAPITAGTVARRDESYATQEFTAFFLSWLAGLKAVVVNEPTPQGLAGRQRTLVEWVCLAQESGLPVVPGLWTAPAPADRGGVDTRSLSDFFNPGGGSRGYGRGSLWAHVVAERLVDPPLPADVAAGCIELARRAGVALLGVLLEPTPAGFAFAGATPTPPLPVEAESFVDALCDALKVS